VRKLVSTRLRADGYEVAECSTVESATELFRLGADAVLLSYSLDTREAVDVIRELRAIDAAAPLIVLSAPAEQGIEALRAGAFYVTRPPVSADEVSLLTKRALESTSGLRRSRSNVSPDVAEPVLVGETSAMRAIKDTIRRLRGSPATTVLITGESGSGKDVLARVIHNESNRGGPFVYVSPSALPELSLEAELFGVEPSPSSPQGQPGLLERADSGTLFLDEIADMPLSVQSKLLRFLQEKAFRRVGGVSDRVSEARVIAASSRDLQAAVRDGTLRSELLYRLAVVTLEVPPLRERLPDIPLLVRHILAGLSTRLGRLLRGVSDSAMKLLVEQSWPGNVRELANVLERAALLGETDVIEVSQLSIQAGRPSGVDYRLPSQGIDFRELEREVVLQALRHARGNQTRAASLLGMTRDQIRYRMAKFGMTTRGELVRTDVHAAE
ncbi:MAG TPA: sigma-54 dependent transcriptional regulator, partial [Polyangiaceae bacterium]|nr:sigma-54 dependent transcriptional regulator [Polyangiaceae bacterium]